MCIILSHELLFLITSKHPFLFYFPAQIVPQTTFGCCFIYRNVGSTNLSHFHEPNIAFVLLCPCGYYVMPTANAPTASFRPCVIHYIQIQIWIFPPLSTPVHIKECNKKGHSEKMLALILMICHQSYWHTLQSRRSIHQPLEKLRINRGCAVRASSHQCRADGVSVRRDAEGPLHAFMWTFSYLTLCLQVSVLLSHVTVPHRFCWGCQRPNVIIRFASHGWS